MEMISHKYGKFNNEQFADYKKRMRKKIFWLIIYTDPKTNNDYKNVDVVMYHKKLIEQLSGLNSLLFYPSGMVDILCALEYALEILNKEEFDFKHYRKLVLDAGAMVDRLKVGD